MLAGIMDDHEITGGNLRKVTEGTLPFANGVSNRLPHKDVKSNHGKSSKSWCVRVSGERTETYSIFVHLSHFHRVDGRWHLLPKTQITPTTSVRHCIVWSGQSSPKLQLSEHYEEEKLESVKMQGACGLSQAVLHLGTALLA